MKVFKFGGASVKDAASVKNVSKIVSRFAGEKPLVVISAMGKTTNALETLATAFFEKKDNIQTLFNEVKKYHLSIVNELFADKKHPVYDEINNTFVEIDWILEDEPHDDFNFVYDQIVSMGEILSTKIINAYLQSQGLNTKWVDARNYIQTDNTYREGRVVWDTTTNLVNKNLRKELDKHILITQGFIGGTSENYTTTLGREGSDYSAAIFAFCLKAESVTIWKDVPGVLNADPKLFTDTIKYDHLPYSEAIEMTYYGATVIHPKTIKPLQNANIPLFVKPFLAPDEEGTSIGLEEIVEFDTPAIIVKKNQILISISTKDFSFIAENNLSFIFGMFAYHHVKINMMQNSALTFSICADNDLEKIIRLINDLKVDFKIRYNEALELVTVRHYNPQVIDEVTKEKGILLEQRSRNTIQLVLK